MSTPHRHRHCAFLLAICFLHCVPLVVKAGALQDPSNFLCPVPVADYQWECTLSDGRRGVCAVRCKTPDPSCVAYVRDSTSGECHIHQCPMKDWNTSPLYDRCGCPFELGYRLRLIVKTVRCIFVGKQKMTHHRAKEHCSRHRGRLVKADTITLITLVSQMATELGFPVRASWRDKYNWHNQVWIGLNDIKREDLFVWSDGTALTKKKRKALFVVGNPNNGLGTGEQDCVTSYHLNSNRLDDYYCGYDDTLPGCEFVMT